MNTSLRRISVMVMALIVLLLVNSTVTQVFRADGLRSDPRNQRVLLDEYARQRGQISANGQLLAYSVPTNGRYRFLRVYPDPFSYAPVTGFYSLRFSSTGLERAEDPVLNGSDERLFGRRLADFFTGRNPRGGNVDTTIVPRVQQAAWDSLQKGCNGPAWARWWRWSRRPGRFWRWSRPRPMTRTYWPPTTARRRGDLATTARRPAVADDQPRYLRAVSTGFDVQGHHHRGGLDRRYGAGRAIDCRPADSAPRQHRNTGELWRFAVRGPADRTVARSLRALLQHRLRATRDPTRCRSSAQYRRRVRVQCPRLPFRSQ